MTLEGRLFGFVGHAAVRVSRGVGQGRLQATVEFLVGRSELRRPDLYRPRLSLLPRGFTRVMVSVLELRDLALQFGLQTRTNRVDRVTKLVV